MLTPGEHGERNSLKENIQLCKSLLTLYLLSVLAIAVRSTQIIVVEYVQRLFLACNF